LRLEFWHSEVMRMLLTWVEALGIGFVVVAVFTVMRRALQRLFLLAVARVFGAEIGRQAMASQPDAITLDESGESAWRKPEGAAAFTQPLLDRGFRDAGTFKITEMPGVVVKLLAHEDEGWLAAVYEHPSVGHWMDLVTRFDDDTSITFTTSRETGLDPRPGHPIVNCPHLDAMQVCARAARERPSQTRRPARAADAKLVFETAYAESTRWRKDRGVSAREVGRVADRAA
jgi:hypothetical protein